MATQKCILVLLLSFYLPSNYLQERCNWSVSKVEGRMESFHFWYLMNAISKAFTDGG